MHLPPAALPGAALLLSDPAAQAVLARVFGGARQPWFTPRSEFFHSKIGSFTRALDGASGNVSYTGVGFKPSLILFLAAVDTVPEFSVGFADVRGSRCLASDGTSAKTSSADCINVIRDTAARAQKAVVASFDVDGFTLAWTKVSTPPANTMVVNYLALP